MAAIAVVLFLALALALLCLFECEGAGERVLLRFLELEFVLLSLSPLATLSLLSNLSVFDTLAPSSPFTVVCPGNNEFVQVFAFFGVKCLASFSSSDFCLARILRDLLRGGDSWALTTLGLQEAYEWF